MSLVRGNLVGRIGCVAHMNMNKSSTLQSMALAASIFRIVAPQYGCFLSYKSPGRSVSLPLLWAHHQPWIVLQSDHTPVSFPNDAIASDGEQVAFSTSCSPHTPFGCKCCFPSSAQTADPAIFRCSLWFFVTDVTGTHHFVVWKPISSCLLLHVVMSFENKLTHVYL